MAKRKSITTFGEFVSAVEKTAVEKCGLEPIHAKWLVEHADMRRLINISWGVGNTPHQTMQVLLCGILASWVTHNRQTPDKDAR